MHGINRTAAAVTLAGTSLLAMTACTTSRPGDLGDAKALIEACTSPVNSYIAIDGTASGRNAGLDAPRIRALDHELSRVAACGGRAKVVVFKSSSAAAFTLYEGSIELSGATDQARARRLEEAVGDVSDQITGTYDGAADTLDNSGSDPIAQLRLFGEWAAQIDDGEVRLLELTDGLQNVGISTKEIIADPEVAANAFIVPDLSGASVTIAGIGEVSGDAPPTSVVDALKTFYSTLCERSNASDCRVITEVAGATR